MKTTSCFFALLLFPFFMSGQDTTAAQPRTAGVYANMFHFKFLPGKSDEGIQIIQDVITPAFQEAGIKMTVMEDLLGTKDVYMIIELEEGPRYYESLVPKQDIRLWNALVKLNGSPEKAEELLDRFIVFVAEQSQSLVFIPMLN